MMLKEDERNVFVVILKCHDKIKCDISHIICQYCNFISNYSETCAYRDRGGKINSQKGFIEA